MKDPALGDDPLVDLGRGMKGKGYRVSPEPSKEISQEMDLEEVVEEDKQED